MTSNQKRRTESEEDPDQNQAGGRPICRDQIQSFDQDRVDEQDQDGVATIEQRRMKRPAERQPACTGYVRRPNGLYIFTRDHPATHTGGIISSTPDRRSTQRQPALRTGNIPTPPEELLVLVALDSSRHRSHLEAHQIRRASVRSTRTDTVSPGSGCRRHRPPVPSRRPRRQRRLIRAVQPNRPLGFRVGLWPAGQPRMRPPRRATEFSSTPPPACRTRCRRSPG